ncbi:MAG TPA: hypothetical protein VF713_24260 [Thermoanaerobaculia bacterium]
MKRSLLLGMLFLAVVACAHSPKGSPVTVIINASDGAVGRVDTAKLQRMTEAEVALTSHVRPVTLTVFFDSFGFVERLEVPDGATGKGAPGRVSPELVSDLSATPWDDGLIVEHGEHVKTQSPSNLHPRREVVVGTYTISDAAGNVLEQRPVVVGVLDPDVTMMPLQLQSMRTTGMYLASRVAAVQR